MTRDNFLYTPEPEYSQEVALAEDEKHEHKLMLINDEHNSFEHVIACLVKYCEHSMEQAEQCATITHYKGACDIKRGSFKKLEPICTALTEAGLTVEIQ